MSAVSGPGAGARPNSPAGSAVQPCPKFKALEALFVGEDDAPVPGIALELLSGNQSLHTRTAADGAARFEGLSGSGYQLSPYQLDQDAWRLVRAIPLEPEHALSGGPASWEDPVPALTESDGIVHSVVTGDGADRLAFQNGLFADTIWDHPRNQELSGKRESRNVLLEGDQVYIPPIRRSQVDAQAGMRYIFRRRGVPSRLRLRLSDDLRPLANTAWTLEIEGEPTLQGKTDSEGVLQAWTPADASQAILTFVCSEQQRQVTIALGALAPAHETSGWRQRLRNLGFRCEPGPSSDLSASDRGAILRFQDSWGLPLTGEPDSATVDKIYSVHDGGPTDSPTAGLYSLSK